MSVQTGKHPLVIDFETGTSVLGKGFDVVEVKQDTSNLKEIFKFISEPNEYDTYIFDSITAFEGNVLAQMAKESTRDMPTLNDYGRLNGKLMQFLQELRYLKTLGKNVLVTALEMFISEQHEDGMVRDTKYPMINAGKGKFAKKLIAEADIVGHLEISYKENSKGRRFVRLEKNQNTIAKDRIYKRVFCDPKDFFTGNTIQKEKKDVAK